MAKTSNELNKLEVDQMLLDMRRSRMTYEQIAALASQKLKRAKPYTPQAIHKRIKNLLQRRREEVQDTIDEVKQLELDALDRMQNKAYNRALRGQGDLKAVAQVLKIMERRAKLMGLDAPAKIAPTDSEGNSSGSFAILRVPDNGRG